MSPSQNTAQSAGWPIEGEPKTSFLALSHIAGGFISRLTLPSQKIAAWEGITISHTLACSIAFSYGNIQFFLPLSLNSSFYSFLPFLGDSNLGRQ
jgi:hypothetical protein